MKLRKIEIEPDEQGGARITHHFQPEMGKSGAFMSRKSPTPFHFGPGQGKEILAHLSTHVPAIAESQK